MGGVPHNSLNLIQTPGCFLGLVFFSSLVVVLVLFLTSSISHMEGMSLGGKILRLVSHN